MTPVIDTKAKIAKESKTKVNKDIKDLEISLLKEIEDIYKYMLQLKETINDVETRLKKVAGRLGL